MDIYSFINSRDVAAYCREIKKTWNPFEMAVIIGRSHRPIVDKHQGWRDLIANYPDMPTPKNMHYDSYPSLHKKIEQMIVYEENILALLKRPESGAIYEHKGIWHGKEERSQSGFLSYEAAFENARDNWELEEMPFFSIEKIFLGGRGNIEAHIDYEGNIYDFSGPYSDLQSELLPAALLDDWKDYPHFFDNAFYVDIPLPFKRGDILTYSKSCWAREEVFVLKSTSRDDERLLAKHLCYEMGDGGDLMGWGYYASDEGVLYGDHSGSEDSFEYYRGKLSGKDSILNYVSLFIEDEIDLPELLTMQCKLFLSCINDGRLFTKAHGCYIPDHLHAKYWMSNEEKERLKQTNGLMPWVAEKLSMDQVLFLMNETGYTLETIQTSLGSDGGFILGKCAGIVHTENHYERTNDNRFNHDRRAMAKSILERYGYTEKGWIDKYADTGEGVENND